MSNLTTKAVQLIESVATKGGVAVAVDFTTGSLFMNDIEFTMDEQVELMKEYRNDPTFSKIIAQVNNTQAAKDIKNVVKFDGGNFTVDKDAVKAKFGIDVEQSAPHRGAKATVTVEDEKDRKIKELEQQIEELKLQVAEQPVYEEDLIYPDNFYNVYEDDSLLAPVQELDDEDIQDIIDDLKGVEVPEYSFVSHRVGDTLVLKLNDDQGISYVVTRDYYVATVE